MVSAAEKNVFYLSPLAAVHVQERLFVHIHLFRSQTRDVVVLISAQSPHWCCCCAVVVGVPAAFRARTRESGGGAEAEKRGEEGGPQGWKGKEKSALSELPREPKRRDLPPRTHHEPAANQSPCIPEPSSSIQLLIHGSLKQM